MNQVVDISDKDRRLDTASRWIVRMDSGLSADERVELQRWMAENPKNAARLLSMAKRWDKMHDLSRLAELFPEADMTRGAKRTARVWYAAAAAAMLVLSVGLFLFASVDLGDNTDTPVPGVVQAADQFETAIGEQSTVTLSDGSIVVLNTNSLIRVAYSNDARVLHLERGEIHVEVFDDPSRPFSVVAADRIVQAVGTAFSVEITEDQRIELVVTEGKVVVGIHAPTSTQSVAPALITQSSSNTVEAGEEMVLGVADEVITAVTAEDIEVKLSWREGRLVFRGEPLEAALAEIERYTTVQFIFIDEDLKTREVTGRFRAGDVDGLLIALRMNFDIVHERADDGRVYLSNL